jgi:flagellar motility protein MotE (MotC chaperone)
MVVVATLSFSVKLIDIYAGVNALNIEAHAAEDKKEDDKKEDDKKEEEAKSEDSKEKSTEKESKVDEKAEGKADKKTEDKVESKEKAESKEKTESDETLSKWRDANEEDFGFNSVKMENLQNLEARRKELDQFEKDLKIREALIMASQQEMERKFEELSQMRTQIETLLNEQSEEELKEINRLVKIYEGMKAKEAAAIFNTLDLDILVEVLGIMSERKASPIIAKMNTERAKTVTIMLAERKTLPVLPEAQPSPQ